MLDFECGTTRGDQYCVTPEVKLVTLTRVTSLAYLDDEYRTARGGWSSLLSLSCAACESDSGLYQKDGPGPLLRCYANRFVDLDGHTVRRKTATQEAVWNCESCNATLGNGFTYEDSRWAFDLVASSVIVEVVETEASIDPLTT